MTSEFPYQLVVFLDRMPKVREPVYYGENGWYVQLAIKRRFKFIDGNEDDFVKLLKSYFSKVTPLNIETLDVKTNERIPVKFIEVQGSEVLLNLHNNLIEFLGDKIISRYPERDGVNYLPHITAEHDNKEVIDIGKYVNRQFKIKDVWLLKDVDDWNSIAYARFPLTS